MESALKNALKSLCCSYGLSYGVLWRFDRQNPIFLTMGEAYEDRLRGFIDDMLCQVHMLGQGIVGEAALTGKGRWIHSDTHSLDESLTHSDTHSLDESLTGSISYQHVDAEVGSVEFRDQFSSGVKTVVIIPLESHGVVQFGSTKKIPESFEFSDQIKKLFLRNTNVELLKSSVSLHCGNYGLDEWFDSLFSNENQVKRPPSTSDELTREICDTTNVTRSPSSVTEMHHESMDTLLTDPDFVLSDMMSLEQMFPSEATPVSPFIFPPFPTTPVTYNEAKRNLQEVSPFASAYNIEELLDGGNSTQLNSGQLVGNRLLDDVMKSVSPVISIGPLDSQDGKMTSDQPSAHSDYCIVNDGFQWPAPPQDSRVHDLSSVDKHHTPSFQSNVTGTFSNDASGEVGEPFTCHVQDFTVSNCMSGISELDPTCVSRPRKGLFSELSLEQLLTGTFHNSASANKCCYDDPYSASKRRKTGCSSSQIQSEVSSCLSERISSFQNHQEVTEQVNIGLQRDCMLKQHAGLWVENSHSINRAQGNTKSTKKRAKPGESSRPRPKDRQQFQDRLGELRKMIPNTGKCSIDALLDSTIKHMCFLQNVAKYAEKLNRIRDMKEKGLISKSNVNGATWAFELCNHAMICPIKVEDVGLPGQMLIEMLCDNGVSFLEIADTIRGLGLCILNGSMEDRNDKTWAHFIVEAEESRSLTRVEVFWPLAQHLQRMDSINQLPIKIIDDMPGDSYNQPQQQPILADTFI